jgi:VWFA-related protein
VSRPIPIALLFTFTLPLVAQQEPAGAPPARQPFATGTTAVVVDAVVRDGRGRPVTDLRKDDFELLENGVRQDIVDVALVTPAAAPQEAAGPTASVPGAAASPEARRAVATPTFVALVFDRLSPEARALAHRGALAYLDTFHEDDFAGVFLSDRSLVTIQTYTNDRARLKRAIDEAASRATSVFDRDSTREVKDLVGSKQGDAHPDTPDVASADSIGRPVDGSAGPGRIPAALVTSAMFNTWEALSRERQGYGTTNALLAVTSALGLLPGRKTVVFFAEGLAIPDAVLPHFRNVIATANRGNVSVYTIDAAGLRVHSEQAAIGRQVRAMGGAGITLNPDGSNQSSIGMLIANEDTLRRDARTSLTLLAEGTGGFLIENTNDLAAAFRTIDADRRFHYLLSYTPKNDDFNGEWRALTVKVPGRNVEVRARSGYVAVRAPGAIPLLAYEGPALAALERTPHPTDVPVRAAVHVFPGGAESRLTVLAAARGSDLTFARDEKAGTYRTDFTVLARIRNAAGEIVRKASQPYRLSGPIAEIDRARGGDVLFFRQPTLGPGTYALDVAVHDALAKRAGVHSSTFTVPPPTPGGLDVSSVVVVRRGERVPVAEQSPDNPLYVGDVLIYPNLGEPTRMEDKAVTLFFVIASKQVPRATLEVVRDGKPLAALPVTLDPPDATGRIRQLVQIPTSTLAPGEYTLRLVVTQGGARHVREVALQLAR